MTGSYPDPKYPGPGQRSDPYGLGFPVTCPPRFTIAHGTIVTANRAYYMRWIGSGPVSKIGIDVGAQSGSMSVALFSNTGSGRSAAPGTRLVTTGAISVPAVGYREVALGATYDVLHGDWVLLSCDNTTATFRELAGGALDSNLAAGDFYYQASAHPAPSSPGTLIAVTGRPFSLVGVP